MNNWKILTIYVCFYLVQSVQMRTLLSAGMTLFISYQNGDIQTHDFDANANAHHLYEKVSPGIVLSCGGKVINNNAELLCELGIGAESFIAASLHIPISDPMSVYKMFQFVLNIETVGWWSDILLCAQNNDNQTLNQCQSNYYCCHQWRHYFTCEDGKITSVSVMWSRLSGNINFNYVPTELITLDLRGNAFTEIDLNGLKDSKLVRLYLSCNCLSNFDFDQLIGSSLEILYLRDNQLNNINLNGLHKTKLESLYLDKNHLNSFDLNTLTHSSLTHLRLQHNQINIIDLRGLKQSKLEKLDLSDNQINVIDFSELNGASLETLYLSNNSIASVNFTALIGSKLRYLDLEINPIRYVYGWEYLKDPSSQLTELYWYNGMKNQISLL